MYGLETFAFDRLEVQRNKYMRCTLMTVAPSGLERRGLWNGQIRRFVDSGEAGQETNWQTLFRAWRDQVDACMSETAG